MRPQLSVVSPVYQAEGCIEELHRRLTAALGALGTTYEIVLVDDGSRDRSAMLVAGLAKSDPHTTAVILSRNFGQHAAILAGVAETRGDAVVVMDCDLQDRPEDIPLLLGRLAEGYDVVVARRQHRTGSWLNRAASRLWFSLINRFSDFPIEPGSGSFSVLTREVVEQLLRMPNRHTHYSLVLRWLGFRQTTVTVEDGGRFAGRSSYSLRRLVSHAISGIVAHSNRLLYFSIYAGFAFVVLSIAQFGFLLVRKLTNGIGVAGWASLMAAIWLVGGVILFCLGVIGIYLARIVDDVKQRPAYIVARRIRAETS